MPEHVLFQNCSLSRLQKESEELDMNKTKKLSSMTGIDELDSEKWDILKAELVNKNWSWLSQLPGFKLGPR